MDDAMIEAKPKVSTYSALDEEPDLIEEVDVVAPGTGIEEIDIDAAFEETVVIDGDDFEEIELDVRQDFTGLVLSRVGFEKH